MKTLTQIYTLLQKLDAQQLKADEQHRQMLERSRQKLSGKAFLKHLTSYVERNNKRNENRRLLLEMLSDAEREAK